MVLPIKLYNTLTRKVELFKPIKPGEVRMYTCGPTVYDYAHIGNFRAYLFEDLLRRVLKYFGYKVIQVMNITDVDDKTIKGSQNLGIPLKEYTEKYKKAFFEDLEKLRIEKAEHYPCATEHIDDMVDLIQRLIEKGYAYESGGSYYFDISKFKDYGKLSKIDLSGLKAGARVSHDEYEKEEARDFALWKAYTESDGDVFWETSLGKGRPGWHIECSAMSMKYLGESFDIHTGGVDNIFPHHENEIAQSEAATGKKFVNYWLHCEHLIVEGKKMSKSLGNFYTLRDIIQMGYDPIAFRYLCLSSHYRSQLNFSLESLETAKQTIDNFNDFASKVKYLSERVEYKDKVDETIVLVDEARKKFIEHLSNDLNSPQALASIFEFMRIINAKIEKKEIGKKSLKIVYKFLTEINAVLDILEEEEELTDYEKEMIAKREEARKKKDFETADKIRDELREKGLLLEDTPYGVRWKRVKE